MIRQKAPEDITAIGRLRMRCFLIIMSFLVVSVPAAAENELPEALVDRIAAVVNNDIILLSEVERAMVPFQKQIKERQFSEEMEYQMISRARKEILDNLINEKLTTQKAAELGIRVNDDEVSEAMGQMKKSMLYSEEAFNSFLSEVGYTVDEYRQQIKHQLLKNRLLSQEVKSRTVVTTEEIRNYYESHRATFTSGIQYHLRHIVILVPKDTDPAGRKAVRTSVEEIHQRIKNGESFEKMAEQYSQSSSANSGGDIGRFAEEDIAPEIRGAIILTKEGDITPIIETIQGYQIFYVQSVINRTGGLDEVSDEIREKLYNEKLEEKFNTWIQQLKDSSHIELLE